MAGRRGHGEGSIYQRESDGKWCTAVDLGYVNGKRKRKVIYGKTRKEAAEKLKVVLRDQQQGLPVAMERHTVAHFFERWLADTIAPNRRAKTYRSYEQIARCHIVPDLGRVPLAKLEPQQVQSLLKRKQAEGLSPRTVAYIRAVLRQALNQALRWGLVARNVAALVEPPKVERYKIKPLTPEQATIFLRTAAGDRLEALYRVALSLGLRQGEALGLRWEDIDFEARTLRVCGGPPGGQRRTHARRAEDGECPPRSTHASDTRDRAQGAPSAPGRGAAEAGGALAGSRPRLLHAIRHADSIRATSSARSRRYANERACRRCASTTCGTPASHSWPRRVSPARLAMEIAGHSDIRLTQNVYTHVYDDAKRQVADVMDRLFPGDQILRPGVGD